MSALVVAVHPDDETLGAGGTLLKHLARGEEVHWLIVTAAKAPGVPDRGSMAHPLAPRWAVA